MANQLDLDVGGMHRQYQRVWLGPSLGWQLTPVLAVLPVTEAGSIQIERGTTLVRVVVTSGTVTINLPSSKATPDGPLAIPGHWIIQPLIIADVGGQCGQAVTCQVVAFPEELISGRPQVNLAAPYGTLLLEPIIETGGWTLGQ